LADFRKMYLHLFNRVTDAVSLLQEAQREGEDTYTESKDPNIVILDHKQDNERKDD